MDNINVKISNLEENDEVLKFTLSNVNVSYANSLRRTILANIPLLVFRTQPYDRNNVNIKANKTRLNNELLKQRISCIPIHITEISDFPYQDYVIELNKENNTNVIDFVTTEDFKIKNIKLDNYLTDSEVKQIFPPDTITQDYIDIVRLRPKMAENIESEKLVFQAKLDIGTAEEDGAFNVVSTCSYGNTMDAVKIKEAWEVKEEELKVKYNKEQIEFMKKDWLLLDAKRIFVDDSFDFTIETVGVYSNYKIVELGCLVLIKSLNKTLDSIKNDSGLIKEANDTMENCYIITIENEDYTIGKIIEFYLYNKYFLEKKQLNFVGFLKKHPHDDNSIIKVSFKNLISKDELIYIVEEAVNYGILLYNNIKTYFSES